MKYTTWRRIFRRLARSLCGAKYDAFWALGIGANGQPGRKFFDQLVKGSWKAGEVCDQWNAPRGEYLGGEPDCSDESGGSGASYSDLRAYLLPMEELARSI